MTKIFNKIQWLATNWNCAWNCAWKMPPIYNKDNDNR